MFFKSKRTFKVKNPPQHQEYVAWQRRNFIKYGTEFVGSKQKAKIDSERERAAKRRGVHPMDVATREMLGLA